MSKKLISAILSIAMIVSMFATAFVTSVGAAAETTYVADRAALKAAIQELYIKGITLDTRTIQYLIDTGILTWNNDEKEYNENLARKAVFGGKVNPEYTYFLRGDGKDFLDGHKAEDIVTGKVTWNGAAVLDADGKGTPDVAWDDSYAAIAAHNVSNIVEYAASVYWFAQDENNSLVDPSFNEGRNVLVKKATSMINDVLSALKKEVTSSKKPDDYAKVFDGSHYRGFQMLSGAYNQSIGVNPYYNGLEIGEDKDAGTSYFNDSYYHAVLGQYPVRWFTFDEIRANPETADLLFAFEVALRNMALNDGSGVLYYDFINGKYADFNDTFDALCEALLGDVTANFSSVNIDDQIKAYCKLKAVVDIYDLYIKDLYNNIYTATNAQLLANVLYAKQIITYVEAKDTSNRLLVVLMTNLDQLTNDIISAIEANVPRSEQLLSAANITEGTQLVNRAAALLKGWVNWSGLAHDNEYWKEWDALNTAMNTLKNMLPAAAGSDVLYNVPANFETLKNWTGADVGNDAFNIHFVPNFFAYIKYRALLADQIASFQAKVNGVDGSITLDSKDEHGALKDTINKYRYLVGAVTPVIGDHNEANEATLSDALYTYYLFESFDYATPDANYETTGTYTLVKQNATFVNMFKSAGLGSVASINTSAKVPNATPATYDAELAVALMIYKTGRSGLLGKDGQTSQVSSIYESVVGWARGLNKTVGSDPYRAEADNCLNYDTAIDVVYNSLFNAYTEAMAHYTDKGIDADGNYVKHACTSSTKFDWTNGSYTTTTVCGDMVKKIEDALKHLTKDLTVLMGTYAYKLDRIGNFFGWITDAGVDRTNETTHEHTFIMDRSNWAEWSVSEFYPKGYMLRAVQAANKLNMLLDQHYNVAADSEATGEVKGSYGYATTTTLVNAYDNFIDAVKALLTDAGSAALDQFLNSVDKAVSGYYGTKLEAKDYYNELYQKLAGESNEKVSKYLGVGDAASQPYLHFGYRLSYVMYPVKADQTSTADWVDSDRYNSAVKDPFGHDYTTYASPFKNNLYNPINGHLDTSVDVTGFARDWAEEYNNYRNLANAAKGVLDALVNAGANQANYGAAWAEAKKGSDMPLWYAERVLKELNDLKAEGNDNSVAALAAYKAELSALVEEASAKNIYEYVTDTDEQAAVWAAFVKAFDAAQKVVFDARESKANIDAAQAALEAAMAELEKIEAPEGASTADTLNAKIADAEALVARADLTTSTAKAALIDAIYAAKKVMQFNVDVLNSKTIDDEIATLTSAMTALENDMYKGTNLRRDVKVFEMKVVEDLYTEVSYARFANAVKSAYETADTANLKESEYEAARADVEDKFNGLKEAPVVTPEPEPEDSDVKKQAIEVYNELSADYAALDASAYTADSVAAFKAAIDTLKANIDGGAEDTTLIDNIISAKLAKAALVVNNPDTLDD